MQFPQARSISMPGVPVAGILWFSLCALIAWALSDRVATPAAGLATAIGLLTLFVAAIVATFSLRYMRADRQASRFFVKLGLLVASVLGFLVADNLIALGATWCASGWLLAGLIGHADDWHEASAAAKRARLTFLLGDAALLAGLGILSWYSGSMQVGAILAGVSQLPDMATNTAALLLVIAAAARCALPPFAGWLFSSMTAPTPVSALMHAGLVNAGGFLLIRFAPVLEAAPVARVVATLLGLLGAIYGVGVMMVRPDIKRSLAGSTVSQMGFMIMSVGLGAYAAALWHIIAHGLFKAWLFLGSGSSIGMKAGKPEAVLSSRASLLIAATTLIVAIPVLSFGKGNASLVPLLLGFATALATLVAWFGGQMSMRARISLLPALLALIAFHGGGLALAGMAVGKDGAQLAPDWAMLVLLVVFLGAWTLQQHNVATRRPIPLPLYVRLLNAGRLVAAPPGEQR